MLDVSWKRRSKELGRGGERRGKEGRGGREEEGRGRSWKREEVTLKSFDGMSR